MSSLKMAESVPNSHYGYLFLLVSDMTEEKSVERLEVTLSKTNGAGVTVAISAVCGSWKLAKKFSEDFEKNISR